MKHNGTQAVIFGRVVPLKGIAWDLTVCIVALTAPVFDPTGLTHSAAAGAIIAALTHMGTAIKTLDPVELLVCHAALEVIRQKKANGQEPQASVPDIEKYFTHEEEVPKDLADIVKGLESKGALKKSHEPDGSVYYRVPW
jgi:hypothetical protein